MEKRDDKHHQSAYTSHSLQIIQKQKVQSSSSFVGLSNTILSALFWMFVTFVQEMTTFDVHVFYKIIMRKMYHSSRLLRHPTRFRQLGYVLLDDVT